MRKLIAGLLAGLVIGGGAIALAQIDDGEASRQWAKANNIIVEENWDEPVTRRQLAKILYRYHNNADNISRTDSSAPTTMRRTDATSVR